MARRLAALGRPGADHPSAATAALRCWSGGSHVPPRAVAGLIATAAAVLSAASGEPSPPRYLRAAAPMNPTIAVTTATTRPTAAA